MTEAELKRAVLAMAYRHGWLVYHVPATNVRGSQGRGYPDLTLARESERCPHCGRGCRHVELKTETGRLTVEQEAWRKVLDGAVVRPSDLLKVEDLLR